jgi:hypothetical protein
VVHGWSRKLEFRHVHLVECDAASRRCSLPRAGGLAISSLRPAPLFSSMQETVNGICALQHMRNRRITAFQEEPVHTPLPRGGRPQWLPYCCPTYLCDEISTQPTALHLHPLQHCWWPPHLNGRCTGKLSRVRYLLNMIRLEQPRQAERQSMRTGALGCAAGAVLSLTACNTVTRGTEETVTISTTPASARIWTSLGHQCPRSPCMVRVSRKTEFTAYAAARGYRPGSLLVQSVLTDQAAPGVLGNAILPGGSVGLVLDAANGAMLDHRPNPAHIDLVAVARARHR